MSLAAGDKLGPYEVVGPVGAGGMGEVFRARDVRLSREVAIKVLPAALADHPDRLARFEAEARAAAGVSDAPVLSADGRWIYLPVTDTVAHVWLLTAGPTAAHQ